MPDIDPVSTSIAGIGALAKIWQGFSQAHQAHKINKNNPFPTQTVNPLYAQNLVIAENAAKVGLPQQQYNQGVQNIARNTNMGLRQVARLGRPASAAGIVRASNDATGALDIADAQARMANQRATYGFRDQLANQQDQVWDWNNKSKFLARTAEAQALKGAGQQNKMAGLNDLSTLGLYGLYGRNPNQVAQKGQQPIYDQTPGQYPYGYQPTY